MATTVDLLRSSSVFDENTDDDDDIIEVGSEPVQARSSRQPPDLAQILRPSTSRLGAASLRQHEQTQAQRLDRIRRRRIRESIRARHTGSTDFQSLFTPQSNSRNSSSGPNQVIDLTTEDASPPASNTDHQSRESSVETSQHSIQTTQASTSTSTSTSTTSRNPRRTTSQRISPPSLNRSDDHTFTMASSPDPSAVRNVIDLTVDSPEEQGRRVPSWQSHDHQPSRAHLHRHARPAQQQSHHQDHIPTTISDELIDAELGPGGRLAQGLGALVNGLNFANFAAMFHRGGNVGNSLNFAQPRLDVTRSAFDDAHSPIPHLINYHRVHHRPPGADFVANGRYHQSVPRPKPRMEPVPKAREGFTRDTVGEPEEGEEEIVVCPACNEELAYDPSEKADTDAVGDTKGTLRGKKRRRPVGEHHFWALKKCGHVYCASCFDGRRPTKSSPNGVGFQTADGLCATMNTPGSLTDIRCAVEGCETKVANKGEWVGIYL